MAALAVRPLSTLDVPALRHVHQRVAVLDWDARRAAEGVRPVRQAISLLLPGRGRERTYIALVDGVVCATLGMLPQEIGYRWDVTMLTAGSSRSDMDDDAVRSLWATLLEYGVAESGSAGARRLFAVTDEVSVACQSLRATGFEPYTRQTLLRTMSINGPYGVPQGMRRQEASDVWSIHQLYHHVTPRPVQYAEARTSDAWKVPSPSRFDWFVPDRRQTHQVVLETTDGIVAYCRVSIRHNYARIDLLAEPSTRDVIGEFVSAAVNDAGASSCVLEAVLPQYSADLIWPLERIGFQPVADRVALVRHTTVPAVVHGRFAVAPVDGERVPKGVPSYYRMRVGGQSSACAAVESRVADRMER